MSANTINDRLAEAESDTDYSGYLIGEVIENNDPLGLSRIKVKIPDLFEPNEGPVPWIGPHKKSPFGIGKNFGVYGSPAIGSKVRVKLQDNDPHYALYEADEYDKSAANDKFKSPKTWGFKDPGGSELFVNYESGQWEFTHSSGLTLKYRADGQLALHVPGDREEIVDKTWAANITGNLLFTVGGSIELVSNNASIEASGSLSISTPSTTVASQNVVFESDKVSTTSVLEAGNGATGVFISKDDKTVTVVKGIVVSIV